MRKNFELYGYIYVSLAGLILPNVLRENIRSTFYADSSGCCSENIWTTSEFNKQNNLIVQKII